MRGVRGEALVKGVGSQGEERARALTLAAGALLFPLICILAELVQQVYRVAKAISASGLRFRSACMTGGEEERGDRGKSWRTQEAQLDGGLDLLVATPGRLLSHLRVGNVKLTDCKSLVMDEVDVLLGERPPAFAPVPPALLDRLG